MTSEEKCKELEKLLGKATDILDQLGDMPSDPGDWVEGWDEFAGHTPHRPFIDAVKYVLRCRVHKNIVTCGGFNRFRSRRITEFIGG